MPSLPTLFRRLQQFQHHPENTLIAIHRVDHRLAFLGQRRFSTISGVGQQINYALFAAHPELVSGDSLEYCMGTTPQLWIADSIYNHAVALQHAISRYREASEARRHFTHTCSGE